MAKKRTTTETTTPAITDTPLRLEWRSPSELAENPANWRRHPEAQVNALTDVLSEVGWAGACLYNERTQRLIDLDSLKDRRVFLGGDMARVITERDEVGQVIGEKPIAVERSNGLAMADLLLSPISHNHGVS